MSDLSIPLDAHSRAQLPVSAYFDESLFRREQELIFQHAPRYLGHALALPEVGDYVALPQEREGRALIRTPDGIELVSNVCRHRQAVMLRGRGRAQGQHVVCPLHRWTYDLHGRLVGAPHFDCDPGLDLRNYPLQNWNGLLFEHNGRDVVADLAAAGGGNFDFNGYQFDRAIVHECDYNWKTFIEVYLEDYHVGRCRPWGCTVRWPGPARPPTSAGTTRCCSTGAASRRRTARSGSPTTRRRWSSGTRTCWSSARCTRRARGAR